MRIWGSSSAHVADHPVDARDLPLSKRPTRRLGCIRWFKKAAARRRSLETFEKMVEDLQLAGKAKRTVYGYVREVRKLADFHQKSPAKITENDLRSYLLHQIIDQEVASGSQSVTLSGIKFFYRTTCPRKWKVLDQTKINYGNALPEVITQRQVFQMIDACRTFRMKSFTCLPITARYWG